MALPAPQAAANTLIGGQYSVDLTRPLPSAGGGMAAFAEIVERLARDE